MKQSGVLIVRKTLWRRGRLGLKNIDMWRDLGSRSLSCGLIKSNKQRMGKSHVRI